MVDWVQYRFNDLAERLRRIANRDRLTVIQPYFPFDETLDGVDVLYADDQHLVNNPALECDIFFGQGNRSDIMKLANVRRTGRAGLCASWFWDNHHLFSECMHLAMLTDIYFVGHNYASFYLKNELSIRGGFVPMLPIAWTRSQVEAVAREALLAPRSDALYGGYNSYPQFATRDELIRAIVMGVDDSAVFVTPHGTPPEEHRFNRLTPEDRLKEYMAYKACLCVSVDRDVTMRMFDALLAGAIPLVVGRPDDLDEIISPELQAALPIVVVEAKDAGQAIAAYRQCLSLFDQGGADGVVTRHCFARDNHMPLNRLTQMVTNIRTIAERFATGGGLHPL